MLKTPMLKTKYDVLTRNGKEQYVIIPVNDYKALLERIEDEEDYRILQAAKKRNAGKPTIPHEQVMRELGIKPRRLKRKA